MKEPLSYAKSELSSMQILENYMELHVQILRTCAC